jgi:hypothetical protein
MSAVKTMTDWLYILGQAIYGFVLVPAYHILYLILTLLWETIKAACLITFTITKELIMIAGLIMLSFFRMFVLGIVMRG